MRITIQTVSDLKHYFGGVDLRVDFPGTTLAEFTAFLRRVYRYDVNEHPHTMIFVNGRGYTNYNRLLNDGDRIFIIPILAAG